MVGGLACWASARRGRAAAWIAVDAGVALPLCLVMLRSVEVTAARAEAPAATGVVLVVVCCAGVALRRLAPVPVLLVVAAAASALAYLGFAQDPMVAVALTLYAVAVAHTWPVSAGTLGAALVGVGVSARSPIDWVLSSDRVVATVVVLGAAWAIGVAMRTQRRYAEGLVRQAEERVQAQTDRAQRALVEQRLRIARELHDIVAHTISVIAVQAGAGAHVAASRPQDSLRVLGTIEESSRVALTELRHMLGVLRDSGTGEVALGPAPALDALPALVDQTRVTGLAIDLSTTGVPRPLPGGIELAAYRIVQEALTNVVRHAGATRVRVHVRYQPDRLMVSVVDDGRGALAATVAGHGIAGMRERATLYGGACLAGGVPGGYRVSATLPVTDGDAAVGMAAELEPGTAVTENGAAG
jgi:signal transduction histidine kinase